MKVKVTSLAAVFCFESLIFSVFDSEPGWTSSKLRNSKCQLTGFVAAVVIVFIFIFPVNDQSFGSNIDFDTFRVHFPHLALLVLALGRGATPSVALSAGVAYEASVTGWTYLCRRLFFAKTLPQRFL